MYVVHAVEIWEGYIVYILSSRVILWSNSFAPLYVQSITTSHFVSQLCKPMQRNEFTNLLLPIYLYIHISVLIRVRKRSDDKITFDLMMMSYIMQ